MEYFHLVKRRKNVGGNWLIITIMKAVVRPSMVSSWPVVPQPHPAFNILSLSPLPKPSTECLLTVLAPNKTLNLFIFLLRIIIDYIQFSVFTLLKLRHLHIIKPVSTVSIHWNMRIICRITEHWLISDPNMLTLYLLNK